jgi:hypothetical protein
MRRIVRGEPLVVSVVFKDGAGAIVTPASANLYIAYESDSEIRRITVPMTASGSTFSATWDTSVAQSGKAWWSARSQSPVSAYQAEFEIIANPANPGPDNLDGKSGDGPDAWPM